MRNMDSLNRMYVCIYYKCVTICDVTHSHVWQDPFICVSSRNTRSWLTFTCDMTLTCVT